MIERELSVPGAGGAISTFVVHPDEGGPFPTVLFFMDAPGIREELRDMARRYAACGYYVMLPNLFWRWGGPSFDPAHLATGSLDPEMMRLNAAYTHALAIADTGALLAFAASDPAARDPVGTVGYCMGGRHAITAAGMFPERVAAMASLHGGFQVTDRPDSAHLQLRTMRAECYLGFADGDPLSPPEHRRVLACEATRAGLRARLEVHPGAAHGFTFPTRYCYSRPAAERVWERVLALFTRNLDAADGSRGPL